jgi:hypothetical protein
MNQRAQYAQRHNGKNNWLTKERIKLLDDIGFVWSPNEKREKSKQNDKNVSPNDDDVSTKSTETAQNKETD